MLIVKKLPLNAECRYAECCHVKCHGAFKMAAEFQVEPIPYKTFFIVNWLKLNQNAKNVSINHAVRLGRRGDY
jgi:hypothetical protein